MEKHRFAIVYSPGPKWLAGKPFFEQPLMEHGAYMKHLFDQGKLVHGGPFADHTGGLAVIDVADAAEAQAIHDADPAITAGIMHGDLHPWINVDWAHFGGD